MMSINYKSLFKCSLLFLLFITLNDCAIAQNFQWAKGISGAPTNYNGDRHIAVDASGNVYTTGSFEGTVDFDPGAGTFNLIATTSNIFISKLDVSGNFVWAKGIGALTCHSCGGTAITVDASGIYVTGIFEGTVDFDPGIEVYNLTSSSSGYHFNLKLDVSGNFVWATSMWGWSYSIAVDADQNVYTTGNYPLIFGLNSIDDIFITKQDNGGSYIWQRQIGDPNAIERAISLTVDMEFNLLITGIADGTADFDPGPDIYELGPGVFILKLTLSGNFVWAKNIGNGFVESVYVSSIATDGVGSVYTTGTFSDLVDFDPGTGIYNLTGSNDIFISKLDASGNFLWAKSTTGEGNDMGTSLAIEAQDYLYVSGYFTGTVDFDSGPGTSNLISEGSTDIFILRMDASGSLEWVRKMGGPGADRGNSITIDVLRNIYTIGTFREIADFDPGNAIFPLTAISTDNFFISKLCTSPSPSKLISGSALVAAESIQMYSVSPVAGATEYLWSVPSGATILEGQNTISIKIKFGVTSGEVRIVPNNSCGLGNSTFLVVTIDPTTAIDEQSPEKVYTVYPNPSEEFLFIKQGEPLVSFTYIVTDHIGREVMRGPLGTSTEQVDISNLDTGIYFIRIGHVYARIVKQ